MKRYRYTLDPSSKKFNCPSCNKKRFVLYIDNETNEYVSQKAGRCDREMKCGFHYHAKDYLKDNGMSISKYIDKSVVQRPPQRASFIPRRKVAECGRDFVNNEFVQFLLSIFEKNLVQQIIKDYLLGTTNKPWRGSVVFWQVDNHSKVRSGKILLYNRETGRRIKTPYSHISWVHKTEKLAHFNLNQCLFGLHLLNEFPTKPIAIVESEKSACIMSIVFPKYLWMASGSLSNINDKLLHPILSSNITLFPDLSRENKNGETALMLWQKKADTLIKKGYKIQVSDFLYNLANIEELEEGLDIADYFIQDLKKKHLTVEQPQNQTSQERKLLTQKEKILDIFRKRNPTIDKLIADFDLEA